MGISTGIAWTRSTRNFWSGCTKVGPGCDGCYAEAFQRWLKGKDAETGEARNWGPGRPRAPHLEGAVKELRKWNRLCALERSSGQLAEGSKSGWTRPGFWPVFLNSQSDTFDNEVPDRWRELLFATAEECDRLTIQLVTKRITNVAKMVPRHWLSAGFPPNVWLIITVVNQDEADRDIPRLMALQGVSVRGLSIEPMLGEIDLRRYFATAQASGQVLWPIIGGESDQAGHETRPFVLGHAKRVIRDAREFGFAPFMKQLGSRPVNREGEPHPQKDPKGGDPSEWPEELRVQEFPL